MPFNPAADRVILLDLTRSNPDLTGELLADTGRFSDYIRTRLAEAGCRYGIGGYAEDRALYSRSRHFDGSGEEGEPRRLHLGMDIWGPVNTPVMAPLAGIVHSFAFNNRFGDYGATILLSHRLESVSFHTLYGHLSLNSLKNLREGNRIEAGEVFAEFGMQFENGHWPPHLHFQVIIDLQDWKGDYPGVCRLSEKETWLANCPDPDLVIQLKRYT
ncbi:MAG TPA: peptidoglycan DD-metalloendopeptidase family protein [Chitinophagaceae bacterium]|nr:peptidoglycan DD-metalloendopeptidase family protein [Chitinophagaceae bacterium]